MIKELIIKIFRNLLYPHKIPVKIKNKIIYYYYFKKYNLDLFVKEQNNIFNSLGLQRERGLKHVNFIKKQLGKNFETNKMSSEHEVIISSLSLSKNKSFKNILEIGTYDGLNACLLSNLFSNSNIDTIDLPDNDEDFINFYGRKNKISDFVRNRNNILDQNKNINFIQINSLKLLNYKKKYDLIWIDGAHGYPNVCIDIINSLKILNDNGVILCDDITKNLNQSDSDRMYSSIASYETLNALKKEKLIDYNLIYKRLDVFYNCIKSKRKFIAFVKKL